VKAALLALMLLTAAQAQARTASLAGVMGVAPSTIRLLEAQRVKLATVRIGDVLVYDVDSVVSCGSMPYVLLGNSFLERFQMTRTNDQMVLEKRF
jgi:hypothetical protein